MSTRYHYRVHRCAWDESAAWLNAPENADYRLHSFEPVGETSQVVMVTAKLIEPEEEVLSPQPASSGGMATTRR